MLTKNLLKYTVKSNNIIPQFIGDVDVGKYFDYLSNILSVCEFSVGSKVFEVQEKLDAVSGGGKHNQGLIKLVVDRFELDLNTAHLEEQRWKLIDIAQTLRSEKKFADHFDYQNQIASFMASSHENLSEVIYSDLADNAKILTFNKITPENMLNLYNYSLVKGLLLNAKDMILTFDDPEVAKLRFILRKIKFHRLICESIVKEDKKNKVTLKISGPCSVFEKSNIYGKNFANFFSNILINNNWECVASISISNKNLTLKLNQNCDLKPTQSYQAGYIPEEYHKIMESFNGAKTDWRLDANSDFVNFGTNNYSVPDFVVINKNNSNKIYVELFHKWHWSSLKSKLMYVEANQVKNIYFAVDKSLTKKSELKQVWTNSLWAQEYGLEFSNMPTSKALLLRLGAQYPVSN